MYKRVAILALLAAFVYGFSVDYIENKAINPDSSSFRFIKQYNLESKEDCLLKCFTINDCNAVSFADTMCQLFVVKDSTISHSDLVETEGAYVILDASCKMEDVAHSVMFASSAASNAKRLSSPACGSGSTYACCDSSSSCINNNCCDDGDACGVPKIGTGTYTTCCSSTQTCLATSAQSSNAATLSTECCPQANTAGSGASQACCMGSSSVYNPTAADKNKNQRCCDSSLTVGGSSTRTPGQCCDGAGYSMIGTHNTNGEVCCPSQLTCGIDASRVCCGDTQTCTDDEKCCDSANICGLGEETACCGTGTTCLNKDAQGNGGVCCATSAQCNVGGTEVCCDAQGGEECLAQGADNACCATANQCGSNCCSTANKEVCWGNSPENDICCTPDKQCGLSGDASEDCCDANEVCVGGNTKLGVCCDTNDMCGSGCCPSSQGQCVDSNGDGKGDTCCPNASVCETKAGLVCCPHGQTCDANHDGSDNICCANSCGSSNVCCEAGSNTTCIDNSCCTAANTCGSNCCTSSQQCVGSSCCAKNQACGSACCGGTDQCVAGACCPAANQCGDYASGTLDCCNPTSETCVGTGAAGTCCANENKCGTGANADCCTSAEACVNSQCILPAVSQAISANNFFVTKLQTGNYISLVNTDSTPLCIFVDETTDQETIQPGKKLVLFFNTPGLFHIFTCGQKRAAPVLLGIVIVSTTPIINPATCNSTSTVYVGDSVTFSNSKTLGVCVQADAARLKINAGATATKTFDRVGCFDVTPCGPVDGGKDKGAKVRGAKGSKDSSKDKHPMPPAAPGCRVCVNPLPTINNAPTPMPRPAKGPGHPGKFMGGNGVEQEEVSSHNILYMAGGSIIVGGAVAFFVAKKLRKTSAEYTPLL